MITLTGWSKDRLPQVLSAMLSEAGLSPASGVFTYQGFEPDEPLSEAQEQAIAAFFAPYSLAEAKADTLAKLASSRYEAETAGITVNGATIATDRTSQALITGAALKATQDGTYTCQWKTAQGFVTLTAAQIIAIADAVRDHVQGCFDAEATLAGQVEAIEINETTTLAEALEAVDAVVWAAE